MPPSERTGRQPARRARPPVTGVLAYAGAPSSVVHAGVLLAGFQTGALSLCTDALLCSTLGLYLYGVRRLARRGRPWPSASSLAFGLGLFSIFVAVGSGLAAYDDANVTMHVVQHVLLMMVAPPLLALGKPVTLLVQAGSRKVQVVALRVVNSGPIAWLSFPALAWILYIGSMYAFFTTAIYTLSVHHPLFHDATHLEGFLVGYLYWQPLVGLDPSRWKMAYPIRIATLFLGMPWEAFLGVTLMSSSRPITAINSVAGTKTGGETFWILAMLVNGLALGVIARQWFRHLEREGPREDRRLLASSAADEARARELVGEELPDGWSVPWWRIAELEQARRAGAGSARGTLPVTEPPDARGSVG